MAAYYIINKSFAIIGLICCVAAAASASELVEVFTAQNMTDGDCLGTKKIRSDSISDCIISCTQSRDFACQAIRFNKSDAESCELRDRPNGDFVTGKPSSDQQPVSNAPRVIVTRGNRRFRMIQQRTALNVTFRRNWKEFEDGFGSSTDFWIGLKTIRHLTHLRAGLLRVEVEQKGSGQLFVGEYKDFKVAAACRNYQMTYTDFVSINMTSDGMAKDKGMMFSTYDRDNDGCRFNCGDCGGWWWYGYSTHCNYNNPSGVFGQSGGFAWRHMQWKGVGQLRASWIMLMVEG